ncbi:hypothetical protein Gotri_008063, partial [Gossypium trilobum]|nr:hypothetical protein [Gossypium trilobum]
ASLTGFLCFSVIAVISSYIGLIKYLSFLESSLDSCCEDNGKKIHARNGIDRQSSTMGLSMFFVICILHSVIAITSGSLIMFYLHEIYILGHGVETAPKLLGSTPHDQLLIQTSNSFVGLLLFVVGFLVFMVAFIKDNLFQSFFAKGCVLLHLSMAVWRVNFERRLEDLAWDWPRQVMGDILLALSWVFFLLYTWKEKYD